MEKSGNADGAKGLYVQKGTPEMERYEERMAERSSKGGVCTLVSRCPNSRVPRQDWQSGSMRNGTKVVKGNDLGARGWRKPVVSHGKPDAGNPHVRFEEGAGVPCGDAPLYSTKPFWREVL